LRKEQTIATWHCPGMVWPLLNIPSTSRRTAYPAFRTFVQISFLMVLAFNDHDSLRAADRTDLSDWHSMNYH